MKPFMDENFLLETGTAKTLYHDYAKNMPIFDFHCHLPVEDIAENKSFKNMTEAWLDGDHYKWRILRSNGVDESYITGNRSDKEKFDKWAETVPYMIGNPLFHWTHLELKRYFDVQKVLKPQTAGEIWDECNEKLQEPAFTARELIRNSNVKALCTTDDPVDDLKYHRQIKEDSTFETQVFPTFRPDHALNIEKEGFHDWLEKLEASSGISIGTYPDFMDALERRFKFFHDAGCRMSDHSLEGNFYKEADEKDVAAIFDKRLNSGSLSGEEATKFKTAVLQFLGTLYARHGWAMQLHIGALRNNNSKKLAAIGPNAGFDSIADFTYAADLSKLLDSMDVTDDLPKTIIYCLNPRDYYMVGSMIGSFQEKIPGKIQFGTAWWFNDQRDGMEDQMRTLANVGLLSTFIGMLTDSRSILSYTRHEYFRRILCNLIGKWVENGEYPADDDFLGKMVQDICYLNIEQYFNS